MATTQGFVVPNKVWFTLKEACELKGLSYKSSCNRKVLQPNRGIPEGVIAGRKLFKRQTVIDWLSMTDDHIGGA